MIKVAGEMGMRSKDNMKIINPASGSVIMALGIFLYAAIEAFPFLDHIMGETLTVVLAVIALLVYKSLTFQFFHKDFLLPFLKNPVNSFVTGTWIAGISVLCNVIIKYFPELSAVVQVMGVINTILWFLFLVSCVYNFKQLFQRPRRHSIHGVILLSTVATQSLVIVWVEVFPFLPDVLELVVMVLGIFFYICGMFMIGIRYGKAKQWSLTEDWTNTNCIIHGALSITGLAIVSSQWMSALFIMIFWLVVFTLLIIVEMIEIIRAVKRVRQFGWKEGVFTYNISQWARNFTFGMFYAFSWTMHENPYYMNAMYDFHESFLSFWAWMVLVTLVVEIGLWVESKWPVSQGQKNSLPFD